MRRILWARDWLPYGVLWSMVLICLGLPAALAMGPSWLGLGLVAGFIGFVLQVVADAAFHNR